MAQPKPELLPCPFCGGKAKLANGGPGNCYVLCIKCNAASDDRVEHSAVKSWNRRVSPPSSEGGNG